MEAPCTPQGLTVVEPWLDSRYLQVAMFERFAEFSYSKQYEMLGEVGP